MIPSQMRWIPEPDAKPQKWNLVELRCEDSAGNILVLEGFWTGSALRITGNKAARDALLVTEWGPLSDLR